MKIDHIPDPDYGRKASKHKKYLRDIAAKLESGEPLNEREANIAAAVLRSGADNIPEVEKPRPGNPETAVLPPDFSLEVVTGPRFKSKNKAMEHYAQKYSVSIEAIKQRLKRDKVDFKNLPPTKPDKE